MNDELEIEDAGNEVGDSGLDSGPGPIAAGTDSPGRAVDTGGSGESRDSGADSSDIDGGPTPRVVTVRAANGRFGAGNSSGRAAGNSSGQAQTGQAQTGGSGSNTPEKRRPGRPPGGGTSKNSPRTGAGKPKTETRGDAVEGPKLAVKGPPADLQQIITTFLGVICGLVQSTKPESIRPIWQVSEGELNSIAKPAVRCIADLPAKTLDKVNNLSNPIALVMAAGLVFIPRMLAEQNVRREMAQAARRGPNLVMTQPGQPMAPVPPPAAPTDLPPPVSPEGFGAVVNPMAG